MPYCLSCGAEVDECDSAYYARNLRCIPCYYIYAEQQSMTSCSRCGMRVRRDEARNRRGGIMCNFCASESERLERMPVCPFCQKRIEAWHIPVRLTGGKKAHAPCVEKEKGKIEIPCSVCKKRSIYCRVLPDGRAICPKCEREEPQESERHDETIMNSLLDKIGSLLG